MRNLFLLFLFLSSTCLLHAQTQLGSDIDGEAADDQSGSTVSLSADGSRVAIGAPGNDDAASAAGHVRVYELVAGVWTQLGSDIDGEAMSDQSGSSVSLSANGSRVAIGAIRNDGAGSDAGHVRVYELVAGTWTQLGSDIDGEAAGDRSGNSVSLSANGSRVAIGASFNSDAGSLAGHVRIYELIAGTWTQLGNDIDGEAAGDLSGTSVSLSANGSRVAIGAIDNDDNGLSAGHVRVYELIAGVWTQLGSDIDGEAAGDRSGRSVSLSANGSRVAIGANYNSDNGIEAGHVRVYELIAGTWTQLGADIDGEAAGDEAGEAVSLSADGTRVAVGAEDNDGNGSDAGQGRVYGLTGGTWVQMGMDIDGEAAGDEAGEAISISADGTRVAIGANFNDGAGSDAGHVRVYGSFPPPPGISQTDSNGDGIPDIFDPCSCGDPLNIVDGMGQVTFFHDFVVVTSGPGETWEISVLNSGAIFESDGATAIVPSSPNAQLTEISAGVYRLDLWHPAGVGFNVGVTRTAGGPAITLTTGGTCAACAQVPTLGQWGLILLTLLILTFGVVALHQHKTVLAGCGATVSTNKYTLPFDQSSYGKMLLAVMLGLAAVFAVAVAMTGYEMTAADVPGSLVAGPVLAYLLHLLFPDKNGRGQ